MYAIEVQLLVDLTLVLNKYHMQFHLHIEHGKRGNSAQRFFRCQFDQSNIMNCVLLYFRWYLYLYNVIYIYKEECLSVRYAFSPGNS